MGSTHQAAAAGFRTVGSSGCTAQMLSIPPYTDKYRVEIFSPPYMDATERPRVVNDPDSVACGKEFEVEHTLKRDKIEVVLSNPGFHTHAVAMAQRMVRMASKAGSAEGEVRVTAPSGPGTAQPGVYLLFVVVD